MHVCMYVCMYMCTYICMYIRMYVRCKHFQSITYSETVTAELFWVVRFQRLHSNYQSYPGGIKVTPHIKVTPVDGNNNDHLALSKPI